MVTQKRDDDSDLIAAAAEEGGGGGGQQGSAGGNMARTVGIRDELKTATGGDPTDTSVDARDKPAGGDLPTRLQTRE